MASLAPNRCRCPSRYCRHSPGSLIARPCWRAAEVETAPTGAYPRHAPERFCRVTPQVSLRNTLAPYALRINRTAEAVPEHGDDLLDASSGRRLCDGRGAGSQIHGYPTPSSVDTTCESSAAGRKPSRPRSEVPIPHAMPIWRHAGPSRGRVSVAGCPVRARHYFLRRHEVPPSSRLRHTRHRLISRSTRTTSCEYRPLGVGLRDDKNPIIEAIATKKSAHAHRIFCFELEGVTTSPFPGRSREADGPSVWRWCASPSPGIYAEDSNSDPSPARSEGEKTHARGCYQATIDLRGVGVGCM